MRINSPDQIAQLVDDYDFQFSNGLLMTLSVNKDLGDTVDWDTTPLAAVFHFSEKPSATDESAKFPAEDITVMMKHVLSISHRIRTQTPRTQNEQDLFQRTLLKPPATLQ